ncbi:MAG: TonB-dependent receptor [Candidatus Neomarinimicrobiota bacterium]
MMKRMFKTLAVFNFLILLPFLLMAGTTGKITGSITDGQSGAPLMGVNVILVGTGMGAATDLNGYYVILNVPPGNYDIKISMIGYQEVQLNDVPVHTDFTSTENFVLKTRVLESQEGVIVMGSRPEIQRDRTSTMAVIGADAISKMPVTEFKELINLQAGVVDGHFRGGRAGEVSYMLDGISVSDPYDGEMAVEIENSAIQEVKVISGTFSAEYGQAMSGVVNIITKTGTDRYSISADLYTGDYLSGHDSPFYNIGDFDPLGEKSGEITLAGPLPVLPEASFFVSARRLKADGYLYGVREFLPSDSSNLDDPNPANWYIERSGDGHAVSLNPFEKFTFNGKMAFKIFPRLTLELQGSFSDQEWKTYNYLFKYNPDGIATQCQDRNQFSISLTHIPWQNLFYSLKFNRLYNNYKSYVYEDPQDENYVSPILLRRLGYGFYMGGMDMNHFYRNSRVNTLKWNLVSQVNRRHEIKTGWELRQSNLWLHDYSLRLDRTTGWKPELYPPENVNNNEYRHKPVEFAFWLEDKMEFQRIILILGLRWDYFHPDGVVPKDLRDPNGSYHGTADPYRDAGDKQQWSPRLGISYPITEQGAIHISYGHFFQIPNFEYLYQNSEFEVQGGSLSSIIGNADLDPTKTTIYQVGLQQMLLPGLVMELTGYYKDIRNLVGTEIKELYILGDSYARYISRDYSNVRGITLSLTQNPIGMLSGSIDYTYQVAEGNASDPDAVFYDQQSDPPRESEIQTVPLDWDQTHTLNVSINLGQKSWSTGLIANLGSGLPYTPEFQNRRTSFENSERKPYTFNVDLNAKYHIKAAGADWTLYVQVKNLFDRLNATDVFTDTGDPAYSLIPTYVPEQPIHTLDDFLTRPDFYMSPRKVIFGIKVNL